MAFLPEESRSLNDRYRLVRPLARGGMGSVWVARHLQLDVAVAIKFVAPELAASRETRARFEREAKLSAQIKGPHVVHVYDYGIEDDTPYIAMELLDGEALNTRLSREPRLTPEATLSIVHQVSKALRRAHEIGLVHRDLKPGNVFLARDAEDEIVKLLDFGIVKSMGLESTVESTTTGALIGSPYYMSPEQVRRGKEVDHRSDLWSLGVIVFRCLTGRLPFDSPGMGALFVDICTADIPAASTIAPALGPRIDAFLARALMHDPERRFQSARAFADAFADAVGSPGGAMGLPDARASAAPPMRRGTDDTPAPASAPAAIDPSFPHPSGSSLAPSGRSLDAPPRARRPTAGIVMTCLASALTLGLGVATVLSLRAPTGAAPPVSQASPAALPSLDPTERAPSPSGASMPSGSSTPPVSPPSAASTSPAPAAPAPSATLAKAPGVERAPGERAKLPPAKPASSGGRGKGPARREDRTFGF